MTRWLPVRAVAEAMALSPRTVREACERDAARGSGRFCGAIRVGRVWRVPAEVLEPVRAAPGAAPGRRRREPRFSREDLRALLDGALKGRVR